MIPLAVPNLRGNEAAYLASCVESTMVSSVGSYVERFEDDVARLAGARGAVATSSGTTGLHLALTSVGVGPDDLVILPTLTFIASANAVSHCGATPWLFDVDWRSWTLDPDLLATELHQSTRRWRGRVVHVSSGRRVAAIMPVHVLGLPADMDPINAVAERFGLPVVADAAAALGATYRDRPLGGLATVSVASFNGNKTFTCGGGGALFGDDQSLLARARHLSMTARVGTEYEHDAIGYNYRLTNVQAAVGVAQLEQADSFLARKRAVDAVYRMLATELDGAEPFPSPPWARSACWLSGLLLPEGQSARPFVHRLQQQGVGARTFWRPIHLQRPYANAPRSRVEVSESFWDRIVTLPCSTGITDAELEMVEEAVRLVYT